MSIAIVIAVGTAVALVARTLAERVQQEQDAKHEQALRDLRRNVKIAANTRTSRARSYR
jgi:hypothetical protein